MATLREAFTDFLSSLTVFQGTGERRQSAESAAFATLRAQRIHEHRNCPESRVETAAEEGGRQAGGALCCSLQGSVEGAGSQRLVTSVIASSVQDGGGPVFGRHRQETKMHSRPSRTFPELHVKGETSVRGYPDTAPQDIIPMNKIPQDKIPQKEK